MSPSKQHPHLRSVAAPAPPVLDDQRVLAAWDARDNDFGALLYDHLEPPIRRTIYRVLGQGGHEHEDLVQATFEKLLQSLSRGSFQRGCSLRSWATMIASRTALNAIRSRQTQRRYFHSDGDPEAHARTVPSQGDNHLLLREVRAELARLPQKRTDALLLHDVLGHELVEIAGMLGISVSAAQSRLVRGRKELHARLLARGVLTAGSESRVAPGGDEKLSPEPVRNPDVSAEGGVR